MSEWKTEQRRIMKERLKALSSEQIEDQSSAICSHLASWITEWQPQAQCIATYAPLPLEASLLSLHHRQSKLNFAYPLLDIGNLMNFHLVSSPDSLSSGSFNIQEPQSMSHPQVLVDDIDLFLCPILAIDPANGHRLGKGLGCYDRLLAQKPSTPKIGVALKEQLVNLPDPEAHDIFMTHMATPDGILPIS